MKKKTKRHIVTVCSILVVLIFAFLIHKYQPQKKYIKDFDQIATDSVLHIVTSYDPVGLYVSDDSLSGFNHDLIIALQKYTPIKLEISLNNDIRSSLDGLENGKYDLIARNIPITSNLTDSFSFTQPIVQNKLVLIQRQEQYNDSIKPLRNHLGLAKKTIHLPKNSPSIVRVKNLANEIGDTIHIIEDSLYDTPQLAMMVAAGDIDFTISDAQTAKKMASKLPELDIKTDIGFTHFEGWVVRAGSPILLDSLNSWLNRFKTTPEYLRIYNKYYITK